MKYAKLLFKNLFRNKLRTLLTVGSIAASLFLVSTLMTVLSELTTPPETPDSALRLIVRHKISLFNSLPKAYMSKIAQVDGVEAVIGSMWFGGLYGDEGAETQLPQFAIDVGDFFAINPDMEIIEGEKDAFISDRAGALVGANLMRQFGWTVGQTIHTRSNLWPMEAELKIRAVYTGGGDQGGGLYFNWVYFNESLKANPNFGLSDFSGTYSIRARTTEDVPRIADEVDALFKNTTSPTKTETEKAFLLGLISMMGNVTVLISSICGAVIFAVVLVAANTMAMTIRERVREIGVLKALGFQRSTVLGLLVAESVILALAGTAIGTLGTAFILGGAPWAQITQGFIQNFNVLPSTAAACLMIGLAIGLLAAGFPAWRATQKPIIEALRNVA